jgi:uncharacterized protein
MKIVWDESKRLANIANHKMDFADLDETFFENSVIPGEVRSLGCRWSSLQWHYSRCVR